MPVNSDCNVLAPLAGCFVLLACNIAQSAGLGGVSYHERFRPPTVFCGTDQACLDSPLVAHTPAELRWLRRHGYPSFNDIRALRALPTPALRDKAAAGSTPAVLVLGARLAEEDQDAEGFDLLSRAADAGCLYAYYLLSHAHVHGPPPANPIEGAAYLRVAQRLGDWKAGRELERRFPELDQAKLALIDERAAELHRTLANGREATPRPMAPIRRATPSTRP